MKLNILLAVTGLLFVSVGCNTKPVGVVASWSNGTANGGVDGHFVNDVGIVSGKVGQAFAFDGGSNYIEAANQPSLNLTNALTIAFWAKRNGPGLHMIVEKGGDWTTGYNSYAVNLHDDYGGGVFCFNFTGGWRGCHVSPDSDWHHYAVVAANGQPDVVLYLDGTPQPISFRQGPANVTLMASDLPLHIGAQIDPRFTYFSKTLIDGLTIYSRRLSADEIQSLYNSGKR